jgi:hypothetical protein
MVYPCIPNMEEKNCMTIRKFEILCALVEGEKYTCTWIHNHYEERTDSLNTTTVGTRNLVLENPRTRVQHARWCTVVPILPSSGWRPCGVDLAQRRMVSNEDDLFHAASCRYWEFMGYVKALSRLTLYWRSCRDIEKLRREKLKRQLVINLPWWPVDFGKLHGMQLSLWGWFGGGS